MKIIVAVILLIPYIVLTFGIGYYDKNTVVSGMSVFAWFLIIMTVFTVLLTYAAYKIINKGKR